MKQSPIFSLADPVETTGDKYELVELGESIDGYHVRILFKSVQSSILYIDYKNPVEFSRYLTMYNITNKRGSIYGVLFVVYRDKMEIVNNRMIVRCEENDLHDFEPFPVSPDPNMLLFKSGSGCSIILLGDREQSDYVVKE